MKRREELATKVIERMRRLLGPTERGPHADAERHWNTMPRWNEPAAGFVRPEAPATTAGIRAMAETPAVQFNMNAASAAGGGIKGIDGLIIEADPETAVLEVKGQFEASGQPTYRSVAAAMLENGIRGRARIAEDLEGPAWAGSRRGWIEPGEAAQGLRAAIEKTGRPETWSRDCWQHLDRQEIEARSQGEDAYAHIEALAEAKISWEEPEDGEARNAAVRATAQALEAQMGITVIDPSATVEAGARIGRRVQVGPGARIEAGSSVGVETQLIGSLRRPDDDEARGTTRIGAEARIGARASVAPGATIGDGAEIGDGARVRSVGRNGRVGVESQCLGDIGDEAVIGVVTQVEDVGARSSVGNHTSIHARVGNDATIGDRCVINAADRHEEELEIPNGSRVGDDVIAYEGWRGTGGAVEIATQTRIENRPPIPSGTPIGGEIRNGDDIERLLESTGAKARIGENCYIHPTARIGAGAEIGNSAMVGARAHIRAGAHVEPLATIGVACHVGVGARVGETATLDQRTRLKDGSRVGARATVGPDATVGRNAELGAGSRSKGTLEDGARTGTDVRIGKYTVVGRGATIGDATRIGDRARIGDGAEIGGGVGIDDGAVVGSRAVIGHQSSVGRNTRIEAGAKVPMRTDVPPLGTPAPPARAPAPARTETREGEHRAQAQQQR